MPRLFWFLLMLTFLAYGLAVSGRDGTDSSGGPDVTDPSGGRDGTVSSGGECWRMSNGCSTFGLYSSYVELFTPACHRHDVCFRCGASRGLTRLQCDDAFYADMRAACGEAGLRRRRRKRATCWQAVWIYYSGVRVFGWWFYTLAQSTLPECAAPWVDGCLPLIPSASTSPGISDGGTITTISSSSNIFSSSILITTNNHDDTNSNIIRSSNSIDSFNSYTPSRSSNITPATSSNDAFSSLPASAAISTTDDNTPSASASAHSTAVFTSSATTVASAITANNGGYNVIYRSLTSDTYNNNNGNN